MIKEKIKNVPEGTLCIVCCKGQETEFISMGQHGDRDTRTTSTHLFYQVPEGWIHVSCLKEYENGTRWLKGLEAPPATDPHRKLFGLFPSTEPSRLRQRSRRKRGVAAS